MKLGRTCAGSFVKGRRGLVIGTVALAAALGAAAVATATNYQTYTDPGGDNNGAPDITTVHVSNDPAGNLTFETTLAGAPDISAGEIDIYLDTDQNPATGDTAINGPENAIFVFQGRVVVARWTGSDWTLAIPQPGSTYTYANGVLSVTVAPSLVGVTNGFNFAVGAFGTGDGVLDVAPDFGIWNYQVVAGAPKLVLGKVTQTPAVAAAGKTFTVGMTVTRQDSGAPVTSGDVVCSAKMTKVGVVKGTGKWVNGVATCVFKIPKAPKGKPFKNVTIKGTITVGFEGATLKQSFSAKVK